LFSFTSTRTSLVFMSVAANFLISFTARGARFLKVMPCSRLCRLMVYSRVTGSRVTRLLSFAICRRQNGASGHAQDADRIPQAARPPRHGMRRSPTASMRTLPCR
jgi:hypothetical protein